ncbi:Uncharacterised protein [Mycobacterium tuberculosis]|nr:Uncharacterised protein [Mycobacterium tuberculosis]
MSSLRRNRASRRNSDKSIKRSAAYTTKAPRAAIGNMASSPLAKTITMTTSPNAISEYSWVRPPTTSARAVRLLLELTGKPCVSPAAMLQAPTARSSALALTS